MNIIKEPGMDPLQLAWRPSGKYVHIDSGQELYTDGVHKRRVAMCDRGINSLWEWGNPSEMPRGAKLCPQCKEAMLHHVRSNFVTAVTFMGIELADRPNPCPKPCNHPDEKIIELDAAWMDRMMNAEPQLKSWTKDHNLAHYGGLTFNEWMRKLGYIPIGPVCSPSEED